MAQFEVSERRACKVLGQARATQRHRSQIADDEEVLTRAIVDLAERYGRYGYRLVGHPGRASLFLPGKSDC